MGEVVRITETKKPKSRAGEIGSKEGMAERNNEADYPPVDDAKQFAIVPLYVISDRRLKPRERVVLMALMSFRKAKSGHCYPELAEIGARCGLDEFTVSRSANALKRLGYLTIKRNRRGSNDYFFRVPFHDWQPDQELPENGKSKRKKRAQELPESDIKSCRNPTQELPDYGKPQQTKEQTSNRERALSVSALPEKMPAEWREWVEANRKDIDPVFVYAKWLNHVTEHNSRLRDPFASFEKWAKQERPERNATTTRAIF